VTGEQRGEKNASDEDDDRETVFFAGYMGFQEGVEEETDLMGRNVLDNKEGGEGRQGG
jgi:hypothetical protein